MSKITITQIINHNNEKVLKKIKKVFFVLKKELSLQNNHKQKHIMKPKTIITWATIIGILWILGQLQDQFCR